MKNKFISLILVTLLIFSFPCSSYAMQLTQPQKPNINNEQQVNKYNKKIDQYNKQADQQNQKNLQRYSKDLVQYQKDLKQYEQDLIQYQNDKYYEDIILANGYQSVEQYNNMINTKFNNPAKEAIEKNSSSQLKVNLKDTYSIKEATNKINTSIPVSISHIFKGTSLVEISTFNIDTNDIITVYSLTKAAELVPTSTFNFYYNTDDSHLSGYWRLGLSMLDTNAKNRSETWNNGSVYTVSFNQGKNNIDDIEEIIIEYEYYWVTLKTYKTYNIPVLPIQPTSPNLPKIIQKLQYVVFIPIIKSQQNNIKKKKNIISIKNKNNFNVLTITQDIDKNKTLTSKLITNIKKPSINDRIKEEWALLNLIIVISSILLTIISFILFFYNRKKEKEKKLYIQTGKKSLLQRFCAIIISLILLIIFIFTEDMQLPMTWTDKYTIIMLLILFIHVTSVMVRRSKEDKEKNNIYQDKYN